MATREQLEIHYRLEQELAQRIMSAPTEDRAAVTLAAYDELFETITWHDGHLKTNKRREQLAETYAPFYRVIGEDQNLLEIGCGNGMQMRVLAPANRRCVGIDISESVLDYQADLPANVELRLADACDLRDFSDDSFDVAFSSQLIEHIHPEDLPRHFAEVSRVLRPGGRYVLETPHRLTGPHDVSRHFDEVATCFHLKEYFFGELVALMRTAGFRHFRAPLFRQSMYERRAWLARLGEVPADWRRPAEAIVQHLPLGPRRRLARLLRLHTIFIVAWT